jgi:hypothetical protein
VVYKYLLINFGGLVKPFTAGAFNLLHFIYISEWKVFIKYKFKELNKISENCPSLAERGAGLAS